MNDLHAYIDSGILELYAAGVLPVHEAVEVEAAAERFPAIRAELDRIQHAQQGLLKAIPKAPPASAKARFMARLDKLAAEVGPEPPMISSRSTEADFQPWLAKLDSAPPDGFEDMFYLAISEKEDAQTALVWLKGTLQEEPHHHFIERFLILEGTCIIDVEGEQRSLKAGDYISIPRFKKHIVHVTSDCPCKFILQRVAA